MSAFPADITLNKCYDGYREVEASYSFERKLIRITSRKTFGGHDAIYSGM